MITAVNVVEPDVAKVEVQSDTIVNTSVDVSVKELSENKVNESSSLKEQVVWATASFVSKNSTLSANDIKRAERILTRHDHLRRNFLKFDFGQYSSSCVNGGYCHSLDMKIVVDLSSLWENARPYVWKFIGQEEWKYSDGMCITFDRIHVKH